MRHLLSAVFFALLLALSLHCPGPALAASKTPDPFKSVKKRLIKDGFSQEKVDLYFKDGIRHFAVKGVSGYFMHNEAKLNYSRFLKPTPLATGKNYLTNYAGPLSLAEKEYGVDKEIITSVLMVETALGGYIGNSRVFDILSTLASLSDPVAKERLWRQVPQEKRISRKRFDKKAKDKALWAYIELKSLLTYSAQINKAPGEFIGSYAGAMGIPQFMPSRILQLGVDGDNDGMVDLFTHEDAIASVANYLRHFGWKPGIKKERAIKVLMRYNHSTYYANTLYDIMEALKKESVR
ncbi:MAG: lytic murein transglycosylase [Desulfobacterales bacterium]|nr:lytic murein transglycosylase [Desulfobacterales bacterium]